MSTSQPEGSSVPETAASSQTQKELTYAEVHNIRAFLEKGKLTKDCDGMIVYLNRSRIKKAISTACTPYLSHQREFWSTAVFDESSQAITATMQKQIVFLTEDILNELLELGDSPADPTVLNTCRVKGCLLRCGYGGAVKLDTVTKTKFCPPYRYLMHVLSHCLSPRRSGHDQANLTFSHMFVSLVLNVKFNISRVIFKGIKENMSKGIGKFLLHPRFLQMVFDSQLTDLVKEEKDIIKLRHMNDQTVGQMSRYVGTAPAKRKLICHLIKADYQAPSKKNLWGNTESTSQVEGITIVSEEEDEEEVESQVDPTQHEDIPILEDQTYDEFLASDVELSEADVQKRVREERGKKVASEPAQKRRKKVYKYKPLEPSATTTAATATTTTAATTTTTPVTTASTPTGSQLPSISVDENVQLMMKHVLKLMAKDSERDEELERMKKMLTDANQRETEREKLIAELVRKDEEREKKMLELTEENQTMQTLLLKHSDKIEWVTDAHKKLEDNFVRGDDGLLKLKGSGASEEEAGEFSDDEG